MSTCNHVWALAMTKMTYIYVCRMCNETKEIADQSSCRFEDIDYLIFNADDIKEENLWKL